MRAKSHHENTGLFQNSDHNRTRAAQTSFQNHPCGVIPGFTTQAIAW